MLYRITAPAVKSGSRLAERYDHIRSIGQIWIKTGWEVPAGMLESQHYRPNLDQDLLRGMGIVSDSRVESQQSRSNLDQNWLRGMGIVSRRYARNTAVSVKTGVSIGIIPAGMLESQDLRSNLDQNWLSSTSTYYQQAR